MTLSGSLLLNTAARFRWEDGSCLESNMVLVICVITMGYVWITTKRIQTAGHVLKSCCGIWRTEQKRKILSGHIDCKNRQLLQEGNSYAIPNHQNQAVINNAQCCHKVREEYGSFCDYIWSYSENKTILYQGHATGSIPVRNGLSDRISKDLKKRGFKYVGPVAKLLKRYAPEQFTFEVLKSGYGIFAVRGPRGVPNSLSAALKGWPLWSVSYLTLMWQLFIVIYVAWQDASLQLCAIPFMISYLW